MTAFMGRLVRRAVKALVPDLVRDADLGQYARDWVLPRQGGPADRSPHVPATWVGRLGIDMEDEPQLARIRRWETSYADLFASLREDPRINTQCRGRSWLHNGTYATPDAEIYAAMILDYRPTSIVEVGAGFSTLIARAAVTRLASACAITVVDPEPRTDVGGAADIQIAECVEALPTDRLPFGERTLLFIDSSHIARPGGDVPYLYDVLLPRCPVGTLVHAHDIFVPYDYPRRYQERWYTEQYVLHAMLAHSPRYRVVCATHYMSRQYPEVMRRTFGDVVGRDDGYHGASFWFEVR